MMQKRANRLIHLAPREIGQFQGPTESVNRQIKSIAQQHVLVLRNIPGLDWIG